MSYNKCRYNDIKYQRSCTSFHFSVMWVNLPQERNLAMDSGLALIPIPTRTCKIKVEMVHSFALPTRLKKKKGKGKEGESTCKLASGPVAKFISQMQGIEPCIFASKMKSKQMTSNHNQPHKESRRPWDSEGQRSTASAQVYILCYPILLDPDWRVCETYVLGFPLEMETIIFDPRHS